jgi:hypothetical protein
MVRHFIIYCLHHKGNMSWYSGGYTWTVSVQQRHDASRGVKCRLGIYSAKQDNRNRLSKTNKERTQNVLHTNTMWETRSCIPNTHGILKKLDTLQRGPFEVTKLYANGTVQLKHGVVLERVDIQHLTSFLE